MNISAVLFGRSWPLGYYCDEPLSGHCVGCLSLVDIMQ
ncbi:hypothetical protein yberc0001_23720 [Yersinia bercovieri ATCC 43970]|uniref:Uncharacterized protein n=1 Tax=Yersinia bercovieri ATCC 43970 TaxID=349968 RepID=A0ABM9Y2B0_YERBE|nr:hypothetical protein yberc0001_23720 [Yersinia bercovieri ATCC 43970]